MENMVVLTEIEIIKLREKIQKEKDLQFATENNPDMSMSDKKRILRSRQNGTGTYFHVDNGVAYQWLDRN